MVKGEMSFIPGGVLAYVEEVVDGKKIAFKKLVTYEELFRINLPIVVTLEISVHSICEKVIEHKKKGEKK